MKNNKRETNFLRLSFIFSFSFLIFGLISLVKFLSYIHFESKPTLPQSQTVRIFRVIDGDTVVTENNQKIRLIGIDTPEVTANNPKKCLGDSATAKMKELVEGKDVILEKDISDTDIYGRLLMYVWVDNKMVNETLVQEGFAQVDPVQPDTKYKQRFSDAQTQAKNQKLGIWSNTNCSFKSPLSKGDLKGF